MSLHVRAAVWLLGLGFAVVVADGGYVQFTQGSGLTRVGVLCAVLLVLWLMYDCGHGVGMHDEYRRITGQAVRQDSPPPPSDRLC